MRTLRPVPRDLQDAIELADRLDRNWFFTKTRERLRDGDREDAKKLRTMRGIRLLFHWQQLAHQQLRAEASMTLLYRLMGAKGC